MIHIRRRFTSTPKNGVALTNKRILLPVSICGTLEFGDTLTDTAMEADCNLCRSHEDVMVQPVVFSKIKNEGDVSVPTNVTKAPQYTPTPKVDFPSLDDLRKQRDGQ